MVSGALAAALRLSSPAMYRRAAVIAALTFLERILAPAVIYLLVLGHPLDALLAALTITLLNAMRGVMQRHFSVQNEGVLYRRVVGAALGGDVLRPTLLPNEDARASLFAGLHHVSRLIADVIPNLTANLVAGVALAAIVALSQPPHVAFVAATTLAVGASILFFSRRRVDRAQNEAWQAWGQLADEVTDAFEGRLELVAAGRDSDFLERFVGVTSRWQERASRAGRIAGVAGRLPIALLAVGVGGVIALDSWRNGVPWPLAGGRAGLLASTAPAFLGVARGLQELASEAQRVRLISRVIHSEVTWRRGPGIPSAAPRRVEWANVRFAYGTSEAEVLRGVSFNWLSGEVLGLAGSNGSGKSTCLSVLLGLVTATAGSLLIDGIPLTTLDVGRWRRSIAFLPQRPYLPAKFTIRECLRFTEYAMPEDVIVHALERVQMLHKLRRASTDPLGVPVGALSVGERQRIALARVLCSAAPLLVLDEPDANLDQDGIALVAHIARESARDRMVLFVGHTSELLSVADRVVTLDAGLVQSDLGRERSEGSAQTHSGLRV